MSSLQSHDAAVMPAKDSKAVRNVRRDQGVAGGCNVPEALKHPRIWPLPQGPCVLKYLHEVILGYVAQRKQLPTVAS